jgi:transcription antitermination factor NusG
VPEWRTSSEDADAGDSDSALQWWLLWVRHRSEKEVALALSRKGFEVFLPTFRAIRRWSDRMKELELPLFSCYLFCRFRSRDRLTVVSTRHVLSGVGADPHPVSVPGSEIDALKRLVGSGFRVKPWQYVTNGRAIRVNHDRLRGLHGVLAEDGGACHLVVNVDSLRSAVAAEVPRELVRLV